MRGQLRQWAAVGLLLGAMGIARAESLEGGSPTGALGAAAADSVTTRLALTHGGREANPLVNTTPAGLVGLFALKWGLVEAVNQSDLPPEQKRVANRTMTAFWGGASANNLMLAVGSAGPVAMVVGAVTGVLLWNWNAEATPFNLPPQESPVLQGGKEENAAPVAVSEPQ